ncbi:MAG: DUF2029 domain-containing protein [Chloroflexi bacterium]|nr:DUF2029 domain-containing protein [Chloroflexota bacterium]
MSQLDCVLARRPIGPLLFIGFFLLWALLTKVHTHSWQEESRMATVQALVEQGTFVIDHTEFNRTGDKVFINEHFYSDKTPLLSVGAAGAYWALHNVFGLTLDPTICVPDDDVAACRVFTPTGSRFTAFYWLTLIFSGGSSALLVALFWRAMLEAGAGGTLATALAIALGIASPIAPYSIVFAGHVPAALALFAGFWLLVRHASRGSLSNSWRIFWSGVLISLSANIDLTLALFVATIGLWVLIAHRWKVIAFAAGAVVPFALSAAINYWAAGTIVPLYFDPKAYDFFGTVLNPTVGGTNGFYSLEFGVAYAYNLLIGERGFFAFTPALIFGLIGAVLVLRDKLSGRRGLTWAVLIGCGLFAVYLIARTDNYGGEAWGARWFVPIVPLLWFYMRGAGCVMREPPWSIMWRIMMVLLLALSFLTALHGLHDAWHVVPPIVRL